VFLLSSSMLLYFFRFPLHAIWEYVWDDVGYLTPLWYAWIILLKLCHH
jgi:hypothetical protein